MLSTISKKLLSEFLGTSILLMAIIGSGIMGMNLSPNNLGQALLDNAIAVGSILVVIITVFSPLSGAHFNPAVSLFFYLKKDLPLKLFVLYCIVQIIGAITGTVLANMMFDLALVTVAKTFRTSSGQWLSECIATFGLIVTIVGTSRSKPDFVPMGVGLYIVSAIWFTASTSFANPAVTIGRMFSDTFAGIRPFCALMYIVMQIVGVLLALGVCRLLWKKE